jgi:hypothetical protein
MSHWRRMFHAYEWLCGVNSEQEMTGGQTENRGSLSVAANGAFVVEGSVCERCRVRVLVGPEDTKLPLA